MATSRSRKPATKRARSAPSSFATRSGRRRPLRRVLVANRGEIAVRILRTLELLGIEGVAVYSEADRGALHTRIAKVALPIGPAAPAQSYLDTRRLLAAAREAGADAVHPGYGFLSESATFARAVEEAGLIFLGPSPVNIARLGDKAAAREALASSGLSPVPGGGGPVAAGELRALSRRIGFPLLLKAAAGGGGKGIRIVRSPSELEEAYAAAASEAATAFGSSAILAERYLERARHVEVQVLGDGEGGVLLFVERDCSSQRRLQKVLEETPSPGVSAALRERLLLGVGRLVSAERYRSAGTLELLLAEDGEAYYLETNTRIQVEHPISEWVTGLDLVGEQVAIAEGKRLPAWRADLGASLVPWRGAAMELRVNAESPADGFRPEMGRVGELRLPHLPWTRIDTALEEGLEVTPHYDSLLAKLSVWGPDRETARRRLLEAVRATRIDGLDTTLALGAALLEDPAFREGRNHCQHLLARMADPSFYPAGVSMDDAALVAAAAAALHFDAATRARRSPSRDAPEAGEGAAQEPLSPWGRLQRIEGRGGTLLGPGWSAAPGGRP